MSDLRSVEREATPGERIALSVADRVPGWRGLAKAIDDAIGAEGGRWRELLRQAVEWADAHAPPRWEPGWLEVARATLAAAPGSEGGAE